MEMQASPQAEHEWLQRLVGDWEGEFDCVMGPDQPPMKNKVAETVTSVGGLWTLGCGTGGTPEGTPPMTSYMTLGYDPAKQKFVGTFIASCMTHMWTYEGSLDAAKKVLTLDTEGPSFTGEGLVPYQDIIEFIDDDHRTLCSQSKGPDGNWVRFMTGHYYRKK
jgi:hypothetical protein